MKTKNKITAHLIITSLLSFSYFYPSLNEEKDVLNIFRKTKDVNEINFENSKQPIKLQEFIDMTPARLVKEHLPKTKNIVQTEGEKYVLMINADTPEQYITKEVDDIRFRKNIDSLYKAFSHIGIKKENIFVFQGGNNNPDYVSGKASLENISNKRNELKEKLTDKDMLILYFTNHGFNKENKSYVELDGGENISQDKIFDLFANLNYNSAWLISAPCKSYNGSLNFAGDNRVALSFTGPDKNAVGGGSQKLAESIFGIDKNGDKIYQDYNGDGKRSIEEIIKSASFNNDHTNPKRMLVEPNDSSNSGYRREVHRLIYQNADPKDFFLE